MDFLTESDCRPLYLDIVNGYSSVKGGFFLKHYNELDICASERARQAAFASAIEKGILTEKEKLLLLKEQGHWSEEEEKEYQDHLEDLNSLRFSLKKLVIPQQIAHMQTMIKEKEESFIDKTNLRFSILGTTAEVYARRIAAEHHVINSFHQDPQCKIKAFSSEDIDDFDKNELDIYTELYTEAHKYFTDKNFKKIAVCPFFLNGYLSANDNICDFFGKPIAFITVYQSILFNKGRYYKNILSEPEAKNPPDEYYDDLDKVIKFYDQQYSIILGKRKNSSN